LTSCYAILTGFGTTCALRQIPQKPDTTITAAAYNVASANKLLQSAELNLPNEGDWTLSIAVRRNSDSGEFSAPLHVAKAGAEVEMSWPGVAIAAFTLILFGTYFGRRRWRKVERPAQA